MRSCPFCAIASGTAGAAIVYSDEHVVAFAPLEPAAPGHTLVVPREHAALLWDLTPEAASGFGGSLGRVARAVIRALDPPGLTITNSNGSAATQTIPHVHFHLIPRWPSDGLGPIWLPNPAADATRLAHARAIRLAVEEFPP